MKRIRVKVKPNASASRLEQSADGDWYAEIKSPPVDGKANTELVKLVAERFGADRHLTDRLLVAPTSKNPGVATRWSRAAPRSVEKGYRYIPPKKNIEGAQEQPSGRFDREGASGRDKSTDS